MKEVSKSQFANNAIWKFAETICKKIISLVISTILARLLVPEAYGVVALTTIFITFSDIFILNGFNVALIRKDNVSDLDYSTVTFMSLAFSLVMYIAFFISAPFLATFYDSAELTSVLRVITLLLFPQSIATVIRSKATRELKFKKMSLASLVSSTLASIVGVIMAYMGFGVWALIAQQVLTNFFDMVFLMVAFRWRLSVKFSSSIAKEMLNFTLGVLGASFLDFLGNNANGLVIGKAYSATELGYYNRGNTYPETISLNMYNSITSVLLPTLASRQDDNNAIKSVTRKVVSVTEYIMLPMMFGLIAISDKFVSVLLTEKWNSCIPVLICACLCYAINPVRAIGYNVFYAKGESKKCVQIETYRSVFMLVNLGVTIILLHKSIYFLAAMNVMIALTIAITTQYQVNKSIGYKFKELIKDIGSSLLMSLAVIIVVRLIALIPVADVWVFLVQIIIGALTYLILSIITKNTNFLFLFEFCCEKLKMNKKGKSNI